MDTSTVYSMFEEIMKENTQIKDAVKKLTVEDKKQKHDNGNNPLLERLYVDNRKHQDSMKEWLTNIEVVLSSIFKRDKIIHLHHWIIDFIPSRNFFFMITLSVGFVSFTVLYFHQLAKNKHLSDNDLKYRYIKKEQGIETNSLFMLEDAFEYNRNNELIKYIRKEVEDYEQAVIRKAENLEKARLKEQKAKKLEDEAEQLKREK